MATEILYPLDPIAETPVERSLPLTTRLWRQAWLRRLVILALLALAWEGIARWQDNDLMLPTFGAAAVALYRGLAGGELITRTAISLGVLLQGYAIGVALAFLLTCLAVSTQFGGDLLDSLTSLLNRLPAIALLTPHPGRLRAEINSDRFALDSLGSEDFQATASRIHSLLFTETDTAGRPGEAGTDSGAERRAA